MANNNGSITLILGPMFSGKTTSLLDICERNIIAGKKCIIIKHKIDNRHIGCVETHSGIIYKYKILETAELKNINDIVQDYDVIGIDEIQFFNDAPHYCDLWANNGKYVVCSGLNGTYERKEFKVISELIPLSENIIHKTAVCRETGNNASFSYKMSNNTNIIEIGGNDKYEAVDRQTYFKLRKKM